MQTYVCSEPSVTSGARSSSIGASLCPQLEVFGGLVYELTELSEPTAHHPSSPHPLHNKFLGCLL